jgi:hypothetical protein
LFEQRELLVAEAHLVADGHRQAGDPRRMPTGVAFVQLQNRHQPFECLLRSVLRLGERRGHSGTPGAEPILQRVVQAFLCDGEVVPVAAQRERLAETSLVERLQQIVDDLIAKAGDGDLDVAGGGRHDHRRVREALADQ